MSSPPLAGWRPFPNIGGCYNFSCTIHQEGTAVICVVGRIQDAHHRVLGNIQTENKREFGIIILPVHGSEQGNAFSVTVGGFFQAVISHKQMILFSEKGDSTMGRTVPGIKGRCSHCFPKNERIRDINTRSFYVFAFRTLFIR